MKQQLKGNRMPDYKTKSGGKISTKKNISKAGQKLLGMKNIKKPVLKKNVGKLLETFSPVYSIMKGKGPTSKIASAIGKAAGPMSPLGQLAQDRRKEGQRRRAEMLGSNRMTEMPRMMAGGPIKRKRPIDGCAIKGKTRA